MKAIGIDITLNGATIVEVSADRGGYEILRGDFLPLNPNDEPNWEIDLLQGLKRFEQDYDLSGSTVVVGLAQNIVSTRNMNFPFTRRLDILKSLPFELEEELPFGTDESYIDAKTVSLSIGQTSLIAFATTHNDVIELVDRLAKVSIDPDIISAEGSAFANLFEDWMNGSFLMSPPENIPTPMKLKIFFRHDNTLLALFQERQMVWTRSLSWGERNVVLELMKAFNYPYEQAESLIPSQMKYLIMSQGASANDVKMSGVVEKSLRDFTKQLRLALIDIKDKFGAEIGSATLLGPLGGIENVNAYFTKNFGLPFNTESIANDVFTPRQVQSISHILDKAPIAIGLALEGLKRPKNPPINLRQGESIKRNLFWEKTWNKWGYGLILTSVAYACYIVYGVAREQIAYQLDDKTFAEMQRSAEKIANIRNASPDKIESYLKEENEKAKNAKVFEKVQDIEPAMKVVNMLSTGLPSNSTNSFDIRKVNVKNSFVVIEGEAKQRATVDLIKKRLEGMSTNSKVLVKPTTFGPATGVPFAFSFTIKETL